MLGPSSSSTFKAQAWPGLVLLELDPSLFVLFEIGLHTLLVHSYVVQMDTDEIKYIIQCT